MEFEQSKQELRVEIGCDIGHLIKEQLSLSDDATLRPFDTRKASDSSQLYLLQRYSNKWNQHVDVNSVEEITDRDHLLVLKVAPEVSHHSSLLIFVYCIAYLI